MKGFKYLLKRGITPKRLIWMIVSVVAMLVPVIVFHEPIGSEDYISCKLMMSFVSFLAFYIPMTYLGNELVGNRLVRSMPISKEIRTVGIPLYCTIVFTAIEMLYILPYSVFIFVTGQEMYHIADMLILSAIMLAVTVLCGTVGLNVRFGFLSVYIFMVLCFSVGLLPDKSFSENGFGLPLWEAALIYVGAIAVSLIMSRIICQIYYKKSDFKPIQQYTTNVK